MLANDTNTGRVLVVEDDEAIADVLRRTLRQEGHEVRSSIDGVEALVAAEEFVPDLVILDLGLPDLDGVEVCRRLRAESDVPILILTARGELGDRVVGLDSGADDYLVKPFDFGELHARLRALVRRAPLASGPVLEVGDLVLDPTLHKVSRGGTPITLSVKEQQLLEVLMRNPGRVMSRLELLEGAWDGSYENRSNVIDVYVRYLREKVDRPFGVDTIKTVRGLGYVLNAP
jgi:two-component system, OmpR family, response regulator